MADIELKVLTEKSDDTDIIIFAVNLTTVRLVRGTGTTTVPGPGDYPYDYWIVGAPGGTASYEVKQGDKTVLAKKERTIRDGKRYASGSGNLKVEG